MSYKYSFEEIESALAEIKPILLGKKFRIDQVSNDIQALENELDKMHLDLNQDFYCFIDITSAETLSVKMHGDRIRVIYQITGAGGTGVGGKDRGPEKPLMDTPTETRIRVHALLPKFLRALASGKSGQWLDRES